MIKTGYSFSKKNKVKCKDGILNYTHIYTFKTTLKRTYIVNVEEYKYNFFVIKYFLKKHRDSKNRYSFMLKDNDAFRILSTCINILLHIKTKIENASFGFIGNPCENENNENTKRFRIYKRKALNFFSEENYIHAQNLNKSTYLLINKKCNDECLQNKIEEMMNNYYEENILN